MNYQKLLLTRIPVQNILRKINNFEQNFDICIYVFFEHQFKKFISAEETGQ